MATRYSIVKAILSQGPRVRCYDVYVNDKWITAVCGDRTLQRIYGEWSEFEKSIRRGNAQRYHLKAIERKDLAVREPLV